VNTLTRGQIAVLVATTIPMIAVGVGGAIGTYANAASVLHRKETALGVVAAGEGATLVAALVMIVVTMLGQPAPGVVRAALWLLPAAASVMGLAIAPTPAETVVFGLTPLAMTASAEGISFLARRIVVHRTGVDVEAQRRNAAVMRRIAYHRARAERHPWKWVRRRSTLRVWRLLSHAGAGDTELGSGLIAVQRTRLTAGASDALGELLHGTPGPRELPPAQPMSRTPEDREPEPISEPERFETALVVAAPELSHEPIVSLAPPRNITNLPAEQPLSREPVLSPAEPITPAPPEPVREPTPALSNEPETDEREQQITQLTSRLRAGERLTKTSAAELLGVSPATAGRRLKDARERAGDGTGFYA
jgi:hypothetical protein